MHGPMLTQVQLDQAAMQEKAAATFRAHDKENKSALDHDTMVAALTELGVLNGITAKKLSKCALVAVSQGWCCSGLPPKCTNLAAPMWRRRHPGVWRGSKQPEAQLHACGVHQLL